MQQYSETRYVWYVINCYTIRARFHKPAHARKILLSHV